MNLLTKDLFEKLPPLCSQENLPHESKTVYAKFFFPVGNWTWFIMEGEKKADNILFFGYIIIDLREKFGHFTLVDLEDIKIAGLSVERDLYFTPGKFSDVIKKYRTDRRV